MSFRNPDVDAQLGECISSYGSSNCLSAWRGNSHDPFVLFGQFYQRMPEDILIQLRFIQIMYDDAFAGFLVELAGGMPFGGRLFSRFETFAFLRFDM